MKFAVTIDRDEDGVWVVECPAILGCVSQGKARDEALKNTRTPSGSVWKFERSRACP